MDAPKIEPDATTTVRTSDREMVVTRMVNAPARIVFDAWTRPELMMQWWAPRSFGLTIVSCDLDARTGGAYRMVLRHPSAPQPMVFFGRYIEVKPPERLVWTNEEDGEGAISTVTFDETDGMTRIILHELYPSKAALDEAISSGSTSGWAEQFGQLETLLAA